MATATAPSQTARPLAMTSPLGTDVMLAVGFRATEELSKPFRFAVAALTVKTTAVEFARVVGHPVAVGLEMPKHGYRYFHGICVQLEQLHTDMEFTHYRLELVPRVWLLTKKTQSRIFQHLSVPEILKKVFAGYVVEWQLHGPFPARNYCVQYRETDFAFAERLMEEEGIYYFFKHAQDKHTMVVANTPQSHPAGPGPTPVMFKSHNPTGPLDEGTISEWAKTQSQATGKFLTWDHTFELPHQNLAADKPLTASVPVGGVTHPLGVGDYAGLEQYDYPGGAGKRFDGIAPGGGDRPADLTHQHTDNKRTVEIMMQEAAAQAVGVRGAGTARGLAAGHTFAVATYPDDAPAKAAKAEGSYVVTAVTHQAHLPAHYRSGGGGGFRYDNTFHAIPTKLPFRPGRVTPRPVVPGCQTAVVVGPAGEEICTDKYGRIKVQFHWDRDGKKNADSSCWVRVAFPSAGRGWGALSIPRVGQEVVIDFLEGDPDRPICVGCVYNPDQMPQYTLPDHKTRSYVRTNSSPGGAGYNEIRFEDKAGQEQVYVHAQKDMDERVRHDTKERVGNDRHLRVGFSPADDENGNLTGESKTGSQFEEVAVNQHLKVHKNRDDHVGGDLKLLVGGGDGDGNADIHIKKAKKELIDDTSDLTVQKAVTAAYNDTLDQTVRKAVTVGHKDTFDWTVEAARTESAKDKYDLTVGSDHSVKIAGQLSQDVGGEYHTKVGGGVVVEAGSTLTLKAGTLIVLDAPTICLKGGGGFVLVSAAGVAIQGMPAVMINSGGAAVPGVPAVVKPPKAAKAAKAARVPADAKPTKPKDADHSKTGKKSN